MADKQRMYEAAQVLSRGAFRDRDIQAHAALERVSLALAGVRNEVRLALPQVRGDALRFLHDVQETI